MGNNILTILSFFYSLVLNIFFFSKKRIKGIETNLFGNIIITNLINIVVAIFSYTIEAYHGNPLLNIILAKGVIFCFYTFSFLFNMYVIFLSKNESNDKDFTGYKFKILYGIFCIPIIVLPIYYYHEGNVIYSYGPCANYGYVIISAMIFYWFILFIKNFQSLKNKKSVPIITFVILLIVVAFIQKIRPELLLLSSLETIVIYLMYFTIENPDVKMLEEIHKSKNISDSANEEKTLFLYNMTQEIRNTTKEVNEHANNILDSDSIEENKNSARNIIAITSKFTNMTNDILDVGSIDATTLKTYNNKYNIKILLKQIVNVHGETCKKKELKFITNIDHDIPESLFGDSISLKEVLNIILNNSIKYTSRGFVELSVNTIVKNEVCRLIFTIEDSGVGIKSDDINKIKIEDNSLAKANSMITAMNGTMMISSEYGKGTKVKIILDQKINEEEDIEISKYEKIMENISLLAIDDSEAGLKIIDKLLKDSNITIDKSDNGKDCLDKIRVNKYDLILLDEELSSISGKDLLLKIKEIRNFNTPVLLLTKDNSYEYNEEYINEGFTDFILKPIKKDILLEKINKYTKDIK